MKLARKRFTQLSKLARDATYGGTSNSLFSEIYDELPRQLLVKYPTTAEVKEIERVQFIPITFSAKHR